jgi:hypothetical protein
MNSSPALRREVPHPLHRARRFYDRDDLYAWRQALPVGRLVAIRWRLRARCPAGEDDLHRSARRRRRGLLDVALRDALKLRRCWRLLWRRTVGKRVRRVDGGSTVRAGPAVHARSRAPVRDRLVGDLGDVASTGAPRVGTRLAGTVNRRYRSSPAAIGSPPRRARSTASRASAYAEERAGGSRLARAGESGRSNKGRPAIRLS